MRMNLSDFKDVKTQLVAHFKRGDFNAFKSLAEKSQIDLVMAFEHDNEPLFLEALWYGKFEFAEYMLMKGFNIDRGYLRNSRTAFSRVLNLNNPFPAFDFLFQNGADIDAQDDGGFSALLCEINGRGRLDVVRQLVRYGASPYIRTHYGFDNALELAKRKGDIVLIGYFQNSNELHIDRTPGAWQKEEIKAMAVGLRNAPGQIDFMKVAPASIPSTQVLGVPGLMVAAVGGFFEKFMQSMANRPESRMPIDKLFQTYKGISTVDVLHHTGQFSKLLNAAVWKGRSNQFEALVRRMPPAYRSAYKTEIDICRNQQLLGNGGRKKTPPKFKVK